ncbi:MAG: hypothetical protein ACTMKV_08830, partial [Sphingomonas parapaucimobilis]
SADYATRFGYPLAIAGLLDPLTAYAVPGQRSTIALHWVKCVDVGADLSPIPQRIVDHFLIAMGAERLAASSYAEVQALHCAEASGVAMHRSEWTAARRRIEAVAEAALPQSPERTALNACATACWPLQTSSSILSTLISAWLHDVNREAYPAFGEFERKRAMAMLDEIYQQTQPMRDKGEAVDIPALFRTRDPILAAGFEASLERANARYLDRAQSVPGIVLAHLATALGVQSHGVMVRLINTHGGRTYGAGSTRQRPDD